MPRGDYEWEVRLRESSDPAFFSHTLFARTEDQTRYSRVWGMSLTGLRNLSREIQKALIEAGKDDAGS
jgi:hypothetical protein